MDIEKKVLQDEFRLIEPKIKALYGYDCKNYRVDSDGRRYIFKMYRDDQGLESTLNGESNVLEALSQRDSSVFPLPVKNKNGSYLTPVVTESSPMLTRVLTYLEGTFLAEADHTEALAHSFGDFLARMDQQLMNIRDVAIEAKRSNWDLQHLLLSEPHIDFIREPTRKKLVQYYFLQYKERVLPRQHLLRKNLIHNDANDLNVLVNGEKVTGIIDFGDMVYAPLINELAVALTYILMGKDDPVQYAQHVIKAYSEVIELKNEEVDLLYYLIASRLCMSVCNAAYSKRQQPDNEYISVSEEGAWSLIEHWITINPVQAADAFRKAASLNPSVVRTTQEDLDRRKKHISKALSISYSTPIKMSGAAFQYMYDNAGNTYLDTCNNIPHVGHCHPKVVEAGQSKMAQLNTNTRYLYDELNDYSARLLDKFPAPLNKIFFVNSGSAASDLAIRLAMAHTSFNNIMAMEHGYHGNTRMAIDMSHYKYGGKGGKGKQEYILQANLPDTYRGTHTQNDGSAGEAYAKEVTQQLQQFADPLAAFISEPIVGCGGQIPLAKDYLKHLYPVIRQQGGVCISDEVQTGFGRLGNHFWGFEMHGVIPDIVVLGKPIGNGHPMAAVVTTDAIAESFENGMEFFSSFGGNPVSCAIGLAVLDVLEQEALQQHAMDVGTYLTSLLETLRNEFIQIGDVRGSGLFLGVDLVHDPQSRKPNTTLAGRIKNELRDKFILLSTDGPADNVLKIKPPLCFNKANADHLVDTIRQAMRSAIG